MTPEPWVNRERVAEHLGVSLSTVDVWVHEHGLPSVKVGQGRSARRMFRLSKVDQFMDELREGNGARAQTDDAA